MKLSAERLEFYLAQTPDPVRAHITALEAELKVAEAERLQLLDLSRNLNEHPEDYEGPCLCKLCVSYGD